MIWSKYSGSPPTRTSCKNLWLFGSPGGRSCHRKAIGHALPILPPLTFLASPWNFLPSPLRNGGKRSAATRPVLPEVLMPFLAMICKTCQMWLLLSYLMPCTGLSMAIGSGHSNGCSALYALCKNPTIRLMPMATAPFASYPYYRTWSGIRARQLLKQLAVLAQYQAHGFLPGHEASQVWYHTQALVELACQAHFDLTGMSCDLVKAFNNLPRSPVFTVADIVGVPAHLTRPWASFLDQVQRRFLLRHHVSDGVLSSCGYTEGCPLSTCAMALTDLVFHAYLDVFSPKVSSFSFVDNLGFTAPDVGALAQGYNATLCFVELFELELDAAKTYVWAVGSQQRAQVAALGLPVVQHARDLGGVMSYGRAVRNSELRSRMQQLEPLWKRLRRSPSPCVYKLAILPLKFWPRALHAISGCPASQLDLKSLRTAAVRAVGHCPAGSSPFLRLSLSLSMEADPEFYQL